MRTHISLVAQLQSSVDFYDEHTCLELKGKWKVAEVGERDRVLEGTMWHDALLRASVCVMECILVE